MSKKYWIILCGAVLVVVALGAGALVGYVLLKERGYQESLARGDVNFQNEEWAAAKTNYRHYLSQHRDNIAILRKYAEASSKLLPNRRRMLQEASVAYYQIAISDPSAEGVLDDLMESHIRRRAWADVEYHANLFLREKPNDSMLLYRRALALDRLGRSDEAIRAYRDLISSWTEYLDVYGNLAALLYSRGLEGQALAVFEEALSRAIPRDGVFEGKAPELFLLTQRARFFTETRRLTQAEADIEKVLALDGDYGEALYVAMRLASLQKDWDRAVFFGEGALATGKKADALYLILLLAYERRGQMEEAFSLLEGIDVDRRVDNPQFHVTQTELEIAAGRLEDAQETLAEYRILYPDHFSMTNYLEGRLLLAKGNAAKAAIKLNAAAKAIPDFSQARYYLAIAYLQSQQGNRARMTLEIYLRNHPDDGQARELYGRAFGGGQTPESVRASARALLDDPNARPSALVGQAATLFGESRRQDRVGDEMSLIKELMEKAIQRDPSTPSAYQALADVLVATGDIEAAQEVGKRAEAAGIPPSAMRQVHAAIALANGDPGGAMALFEELLGDSPATVNAIIRWAGLFAEEGYLEAGLDALAKAAAVFSEEDRPTLEVERIALSARFGRIDQAISLLASFEARPKLPPDVRDVLKDQKGQLVHRLLALGSGEALETAMTLANEVRIDDAANPDAQLLYARVLMSQDPPRFARAQAIAEALLVSRPNDEQAMTVLADIAVQQGFLKQGLNYAKSAASAAPEKVGTQIFLAQVQIRMQRFIEAQASLERALAIDPADVRALELLVEVYQSTGRLNQAGAMLERLTKASDGNPGAAERMALLQGRLQLSKGENPEEVEKVFRSHHAENPDDLSILMDLVAVVARQGRYAEAEELQQEFAARHAGLPEAWVALGKYYLERDDAQSIRKASSALIRALLMEKDYPPALRSLVDLQIRTGNSAEALALAQRYVAFRPDDPYVQFQRARLVSLLGGSTEEALEAVNHALAFFERPAYLYLRGTLYIEVEKYEEALADLRKVRAMQGAGSPSVGLALAEAYLGINNPELANQLFTSILQQNPKRTDRAYLEQVEHLRRLLGAREKGNT